MFSKKKFGTKPPYSSLKAGKGPEENKNDAGGDAGGIACSPRKNWVCGHRTRLPKLENDPKRTGMTQNVHFHQVRYRRAIVLAILEI